MTQQQETHKGNQEKPMRRKEALAVLYRLQEVYKDTAIALEVKTQTNTFFAEEQRAFRKQVGDALALLRNMIHGPRPFQSFGLCQRCYLHYDRHIAYWHDRM